MLGDLAPGADPLVEGRDREERADAELEFPLALGEVVDDGDAPAGSREGHRGRPAQIAVAAEDQDPLTHHASNLADSLAAYPESRRRRV